MTIEGRNPVLEALRAGKPLQKILVAKGAHGAAMGEVIEFARKKGIPIQEVDRTRLDQMAESRAHQGVIAVGEAFSYTPIDDVLDRARAGSEPPFLLLLDEVQDPQNLGSLIRTADAVGVHGVVLPERRSAPLSAVAIKASAGAALHVPVAQVTNLNRMIDSLKDAGLWIAGATMEAEKEIWDVDLTGPMAIVVGGEGKGLSRLAREKCDLLVRIPMLGQVDSLNAAVAGAILLYEVRRQRMRRQDSK